ncbi:hypothetical protein BCR39DRAFT_510672 [Naematelia encephala]|uniref:FIST domain-containing protein n=1 Tax=Naematelia encephala TaxID=71784 RepID=A0A1Y2BLB0_9TREE|nr:hypothetical protein BCR39DRAFT_510672 [Naematelia encephala]
MLKRLYSTTTRSSLSSGILAQTLYSPTVASLTSFLTNSPRIPPSTSRSGSTSTSTLYLLSTSLESLPTLIPILQSHLISSDASYRSESIGSFSTCPPGCEPTLSILTVPTLKVFRTSLSGRPPAQVGRYQRPFNPSETGEGKKGREEDKKGSEIGEGSDFGFGKGNNEGWDGFWRAERGIERMEELEGIDAKGFLLLCDGTPRPVLDSISEMYPGMSSLGLITAPTPFLTGRPHTLIHNKDVFSTGTLGLALPFPLSTDTSYGLEQLDEPCSITSAQGNMLLKLSTTNPNPTQILISAIQRRTGGTLSKEEDFFLALLSPDDSKIQRAVKILSGDPSRGAISLEMEEPLLVGQRIQFMHRPQSTGDLTPKQGQITFAALRKSDNLDSIPLQGTPRVQDGFLACSEDGFINNSSICTVPGATCSWTFQ